MTLQVKQTSELLEEIGETRGEEFSSVTTELLREMEIKDSMNQGKKAKYSNNFQTFVNSVKIFLGNTFLTIPAVFQQTGWIGGLFLYISVGVLNTYTMVILLAVVREVSKKRLPNGDAVQVKSYQDLAKRLQGFWGMVLVDLALFISQFSRCSSYLYYIACVIDSIACEKGGFCKGRDFYIYMLIVPTLPISYIRNYTYLSYISLPGIIVGLIGTIMIIIFCGNSLVEGTNVQESTKYFDIIQVFGNIGIAIFVYQRNSIIINLRSQSKNLRKFPSILYLAAAIIIISYQILALFSYFTFKSQTFDYITKNLLPLNAFTIAINILFCLNALTSQPVQLLCVFEGIENYSFFKNEKDSAMMKDIKIYSERTLIVVILSVITSNITNFIAFQNIVGALSTSLLGFILPSIYYMQYFGFKKITKKMQILNIFLILFGTLGSLFSIINSIIDLIEGKQSNI